MSEAAKPMPPILRGLAGRCPECGKTSLFDGFLAVKPRCEVCGLDYSFADSGDGPAIFIIMLAGFIVVGCALMVEVVYGPPYWVHAVLWLPLILITTLLPLRMLKGLLIVLQHHHKASEGRLDRGRAGVTGAVVSRRGPVWAGGIVVAAFAVLVALGTWQLERRAWKHDIILTLDQRANSEPVALPAAGEWARMTPADDEYRRVRFVATFDPDQEALVYTNGSALRKDVSGIGYWVMSPARLSGGGIVVVNRGFVPENLKDPKSRPAPASGPVELVGALRWPEPPGMFTPAGDPGRNTWYARDQVPIVASKGWGAGMTVAPFYIEQESPVPTGGAPKPGRLVPQLADNHLQYAVTWYGLALVLVGVAGVFWLGRRRAGGRPDTSEGAAN